MPCCHNFGPKIKSRGVDLHLGVKSLLAGSVVVLLKAWELEKMRCSKYSPIQARATLPKEPARTEHVVLSIAFLPEAVGRSSAKLQSSTQQLSWNTGTAVFSGSFRREMALSFELRSGGR